MSTEDQSSRDRIRAADADRERVAEQLRAAQAEGRLDLTEYDERVQQAWAARTYAELDRLTADLPQARSQPGPTPPGPVSPGAGSPGAGSPRAGAQGPVPRGQVSRGRRREKFRRTAVVAWLSASLINLVIWALVSLSTLSWIYPWWIWVAGPWGAVLLAQWISGRAGDVERPR